MLKKIISLLSRDKKKYSNIKSFKTLDTDECYILTHHGIPIWTNYFDGYVLFTIKNLSSLDYIRYAIKCEDKKNILDFSINHIENNSMFTQNIKNFSYTYHRYGHIFAVQPDLGYFLARDVASTPNFIIYKNNFYPEVEFSEKFILNNQVKKTSLILLSLSGRRLKRTSFYTFEDLFFTIGRFSAFTTDEYIRPYILNFERLVNTKIMNSIQHNHSQCFISKLGISHFELIVEIIPVNSDSSKQELNEYLTITYNKGIIEKKSKKFDLHDLDILLKKFQSYYEPRKEKFIMKHPSAYALKLASDLGLPTEIPLSEETVMLISMYDI